jgi:hypothetical protein
MMRYICHRCKKAILIPRRPETGALADELSEKWAAAVQEGGYQEYEFCRTVACENFNNGKCDYQGKDLSMCNRTAKEFHHWLNKNGFRIIKGDKCG